MFHFNGIVHFFIGSTTSTVVPEQIRIDGIEYCPKDGNLVIDEFLFFATLEEYFGVVGGLYTVRCPHLHFNSSGLAM